MLWHLIEAFCLFCAAVVILGAVLGPPIFVAVLLWRVFKQLTG